MTAYTDWARGICPCCGWNQMTGTWDGTPPRTIGEGVVICGYCAARDHLREPGAVEAVLLAIAVRHDGPIDKMLAETGPHR